MVRHRQKGEEDGKCWKTKALNQNSQESYGDPLSGAENNRGRCCLVVYRYHYCDFYCLQKKKQYFLSKINSLSKDPDSIGCGLCLLICW